MSCEQCRELKAQLGKVPDCEKCLKPRLLPENYPVIYIYYTYLRTILNGYGGLILSEIVLACEIENIIPHTNFIKKFITYFKEVNKKDDNG